MDYDDDEELVFVGSGDDPYCDLDELLLFDTSCIRPGDIVEAYGQEHTVAYVFLEGVVTETGDLVEWPDITLLRHVDFDA